MTEQWIFILAMTCICPAIAIAVVYNKIHKIFKPIAFIMVLAVITEIAVRLTLPYDKAVINANLITNIFLLLNTALHIYLFYSLQVIKKKETAYIIFTAFMIIFIMNAFYAGSVNKFYFYASLTSSIIILFLAVEGITIQTFRSKQNWSSDTIFLLCIITVIYNANVVFYFSVALLGLEKDGELYTRTLNIYRFINAACNLLYIWPILCIPRNRSYIKLF